MNQNLKNKEKQQVPIVGQLATSLNRRDEMPNVELAKRITDTGDKGAVKELFDLLANPNEGMQDDAIKVIYEVATISPELIIPYSKTLIALLRHKHNRLQWGAMIALDMIATKYPEHVFEWLSEIIAAADKGSVITNDHCVAILIKLCGVKKYADATFPLFIERLKRSPVNQLPMYAEQALPIIDAHNRVAFIDTLNERLGDIEKETKKLRVVKVIKKITQKFSL